MSSRDIASGHFQFGIYLFNSAGGRMFGNIFPGISLACLAFAQHALLAQATAHPGRDVLLAAARMECLAIARHAILAEAIRPVLASARACSMATVRAHALTAGILPILATARSGSMPTGRMAILPAGRMPTLATARGGILTAAGGISRNIS